MRMLLNLPDPSADWRGLAHVISKSDGLRDDVTLVVERDRLRFFDSECREISAGMDSGQWSAGSVNNLSAKLSLLDWLYERFPRDQPRHAPAGGNKVLAASFYAV